MEGGNVIGIWAGFWLIKLGVSMDRPYVHSLNSL